MINQKWTHEETTRLVDLVNEGKTFSEVARIMGRKRLACLGRYHREMVRQGHRPKPRKRILESISGPKISPELARHTVPKRVYKPKSNPQVSTEGIGFLLPVLPAPTPARSGTVGILNVTGCRWPISEDASLKGGFAFCNKARKNIGCSYCAEHARRAYGMTSKPAPQSIGAFGLRFGRRKAA